MTGQSSDARSPLCSGNYACGRAFPSGALAILPLPTSIARGGNAAQPARQPVWGPDSTGARGSYHLARPLNTGVISSFRFHTRGAAVPRLTTPQLPRRSDLHAEDRAAHVASAVVRALRARPRGARGRGLSKIFATLDC